MIRQFKPNCCFNSLILEEHFKTLFGFNYEFPVDCINLINIYYLKLRKNHNLVSCSTEYSVIFTQNKLFNLGLNNFNNHYSMFNNNINKINIDNVLSTSSSRHRSLILTSNGLYIYNRIYNNRCKINIDNVRSISIGEYDSLILTDEGLFIRSNQGPFPNDNPACIVILKLKIKNVQSMKSGWYHHLILCNDELYGLGDNNFGQLRSRPTNTKYSLKHNGKYSFKPTNLNIKNVIDYSCGGNHSLAWCTDGLFGWGEIYKDLTNDLHKIDIDNILAISSGAKHNIVLTLDGIYGIGWNNYGQSGTNNFENSLIPQKIDLNININKISSINCGDYFTIIITEDDELYGFGCNNYGQLDKKSNSDKIIRIDMNGWTKSYYDNFMDYFKKLL